MYDFSLIFHEVSNILLTFMVYIRKNHKIEYFSSFHHTPQYPKSLIMRSFLCKFIVITNYILMYFKVLCGTNYCKLAKKN